MGAGGIFVNPKLQLIRDLDLRPPPAQYLLHQSLAASRRHVAASYWTAASDVAATSAPVNAGQRRSTPPATGQRRRITVVIGGQRWRSTTVAVADHRSTVAVNDGYRWQTTVDCRWTTVDHHRTAGQRWLVGRSTSGPGPVWIGSGPGPGRVWIGSGRVWVGSATWHAACQPPTVNAADHRSTVAVNDGRRWRTTVDCRWTTVDHHRSTVVGGPVNERAWAGSESGLDRVTKDEGNDGVEVSCVIKWRVLDDCVKAEKQEAKIMLNKLAEHRRLMLQLMLEEENSMKSIDCSNYTHMKLAQEKCETTKMGYVNVLRTPIEVDTE
nr:phospholipase-like, aminotransferase-like mobile domain protein [Tanacetum cinerariifolium]